MQQLANRADPARNGRRSCHAIEACGPGTHKLIPGSEYVAIDGADLGLCWTHAGEVNAELLRFFK